MNKIKVLHITPHLGGGVGKALSALSEGAIDSNFEHQFLLLETPDKDIFVNKIKGLNCSVFLASEHKSILKLIEESDVVQLEWWNHPAIFKFLVSHDLPKLRLLCWSHVSGLSTPLIPIKLIQSSDYFIFTSRISFQAKNLQKLDQDCQSKLAVISSGTGFTGERISLKKEVSNLSFGYMGSLNKVKLFPGIIDYLANVKTPGFKLKVWSDNFYLQPLLMQCQSNGRSNLLDYQGYTSDPLSALKSLDIFIYLLNPEHYGTAENVLLEAMSVGLVPIVLNNLAEMEVVKHMETGMVVSNVSEFSSAIDYLVNNPLERKRMANNAANKIANEFSAKSMSKSFSSYYQKVLAIDKKRIDFTTAFGENPLDWYLCCQDKEKNNLEKNDLSTLEETKGSIKHFLSYFPEDLRLRQFVIDKGITNAV